MERAEEFKMQRRCFGRFCVEVPYGAEWTGGRYEVRGLTVLDKPLPPGEQGFEVAWAGAMEDVHELQSAQRLEPGDVSGEIRTNEEVEPARLRFLSYYYLMSRVALKVVAMRREGDIGVLMKQVLGTEFEPQVRANAIEVARAFRLPKKDAPWPVIGEDWFYTNHGAIALPFQGQELAAANFRNGPLQGAFLVEANTVEEPKRKGLVQRFMEAIGIAGPAFVSGVSMVRSRGRKVAGMKGDEVILRDVDANSLIFAWRFPGESNSPTAPEMRVSWETDDTDQKEKMALWEAMLDSIQLAGARVP